jgi:hypothetical protein
MQLNTEERKSFWCGMLEALILNLAERLNTPTTVVVTDDRNYFHLLL